MKRWTRSLALVTSVITTGTLVAACGAGSSREESSGASASEVGITDSSIKIGAHFPLTGVAAPGYSEIPSGMKAYFDYVNANGGVNGRKIEFVVRDDGYNPTNTSQVTDELVLKDQIFAMVGGLGTPTHAAVVDFLNSEKVPDLFVSSGALQWGDDVEAKPYTFGWQPDYESEGKIIGQYVAENMPDAKVGLFLQDDDMGRDGEKGIRRFLDKQIVAVERYTSGNTDVAPQIAGLQAKGADLVLSFNTPSYTALSQLRLHEAQLQAEVVLRQHRLRPDTRRLAALEVLRGQGRRRPAARRRAHHRVPGRRGLTGRPVGEAVAEGLGRER